MLNNVYYVYEHRRSSDGGLFYIGKGKGRRAWHVSSGRNRYWKNIVAKHGFIANILHDNLEESEAFAIEKRLIRENSGESLANMTGGGEGHSPSEELRVMRSEGLKRAWADDDARAKRISAMKVANQRNDVKQRRSEIMKERYASQENRESLSKKMKAVLDNPDKRKAVSDAVKARYEDDEERDKTARATAKTWSNQETREKRLKGMAVARKKRDDLGLRRKPRITKEYIFKNGSDVFIGTPISFRETHDVTNSGVSCIMSGRYSSHRGWRFFGENKQADMQEKEQ